MKHIYGLLVLFISDIATFLLMWQILLNEANSIIKYLILIVILLILMIINVKSILNLTTKVKKGLDEQTKQKALKKVVKKKFTTNILLTFFALLLVLGNYVYYLANQTLSSITLALEPTEFQTYIIVRSDSDIQDMNDSSLIHIGFNQSHEQYRSLYEDTLNNHYEKTAYVHYQPFYGDYHHLKQKLFNNELQALCISEETYNLYKQENKNFDDSIRILATHTIQTSVKGKAVNVSKEAFNVLILGVDIREGEGDIHSATRADTIMLASFNPKTMKASLISIPRDSYVPLSYNNEYDKLTHAGSYGVTCLIDTIENLLDIDINYYAKFNFQALIGLVDALGGIEIDVKFSFTESNSQDIPYSIQVEEGLQTLNGEEALAYARHRSTQNDHVRNNSQQEVLKAILRKLVSFDSITKVNELLNVLKTNMSTNFGRNEILDLLTIVPRLAELEISSGSIEGNDYQTYVPKYDEDLWVTELKEESLSNTKNQIQAIHKGGE